MLFWVRKQKSKCQPTGVSWHFHGYNTSKNICTQAIVDFKSYSMSKGNLHKTVKQTNQQKNRTEQNKESLKRLC